MIPSSDRYARCEAASHVINRLPVIRPAYGEGETVAYLDGFVDGQKEADWPLTKGACWVLIDKLLEIVRG